MRSREIEVERQQRRAAARDDQMLASSELDVELGDAERRAVRADDVRADDLAAGLDEHFGVAVVEANLAADDVAGGQSGDGQEVREIGQLGEVDARRRRQHFDGPAAAPLQGDRQHVDGVADEVAVRVRDADEQRARVAASVRAGRSGGWCRRSRRSPRAAAARAAIIHDERKRGARAL